MNVTVTTTTTLIIQQSPYEIGTVIAAFAAFIVSAFTLYFTSLKGPDIVLRENPQFIRKSTQGKVFDRSIPHIIVYETSLNFLNNGAASGVLRMDAHFEPLKELNPFFKKVTFSFGEKPLQYSSFNSMTPISIDEKDSAVIYIELTVEFHEWKTYFNHEPVPKERIPEVLCQADEENKKRFSDFCAVLERGRSLGGASIKWCQTKNRLLRDRVEECNDVSTDIMLDDELIGIFKSCEENWDIIYPRAVLMQLQDVESRLESVLRGPLQQNHNNLYILKLYNSLDTDLLHTLKESFDGYENKIAIVDFILRSAKLDTRFKNYESRMRELSRRYQLYEKDTSNQELGNYLTTEGLLLARESADLTAEIESLQQILHECYRSNP